MPKPMMMRVAVEEIAFGRVFRFLKNMSGVISLDIDGEPDKKKPNGKIAPRGKTKEGTSTICLVLRYLAAHKMPITNNELADHIERGGKSRKSLSGVIHALENKKPHRIHRVKRKKGEPIAWSIAAPGLEYIKANCNAEKEG